MTLQFIELTCHVTNCCYDVCQNPRIFQLGKSLLSSFLEVAAVTVVPHDDLSVLFTDHVLCGVTAVFLVSLNVNLQLCLSFLADLYHAISFVRRVFFLSNVYR